MKVGDIVIFIVENPSDSYFIFGKSYRVTKAHKKSNRISVINEEGKGNGWGVDMFVNIGKGPLTELDRLIYDIKDDV
jgi:hypothetical protein